MFCTQCGSGNSDNARYCQKCGAPTAIDEVIRKTSTASESIEATRSKLHSDQPQQSIPSSFSTRRPTTKIVVFVSAVFIALAASALFSWDYRVKATNRDLCNDLVRFIAELHKINTTESDMATMAFKAAESIAAADRILQRWQIDPNERRKLVVQEMELALRHYRRVAGLFHDASAGRGDNDTVLAEFGVKWAAGGTALLAAVGQTFDHVNGPGRLRLSSNGRRDIRNTIELLFPTELAKSDELKKTPDPQFKESGAFWAPIMLYENLK